MQKTIIALGIIVTIVGVGTYFALSLPPPEPAKKFTPVPQSANTTPAETAGGIPKLIIGSPSAKLAITQYSDPQCPICKRFFEQTEPQLLKSYIDTGKAYIEIKVETHIGERSQLAGEAWYCAADQNKFKEFHDQTLTRQGNEQFTEPLMKVIAGQIGLDTAAFGKCLDSGKYTQIVIDSNNESKSRISSTPTFFIGDQKIVGAQPFSVFKTVIEAELK